MDQQQLKSDLHYALVKLKHYFQKNMEHEMNVIMDDGTIWDTIVFAKGSEDEQIKQFLDKFVITCEGMMEKKVKQILMEFGPGPSEDAIVPEASIVDDLKMDSLDCIEILMTIEEEFDLEISDEDAEKWKTVGDIHEYLKGRGK